MSKKIKWFVVFTSLLFFTLTANNLSIEGSYKIDPRYFYKVPINIKDGDRATVIDLNYEKKILSIGYEKGIIDFVNIKTNTIISIKAHDLRVNHLTSSLNTNISASSSYFESETKIWDNNTGQQIKALPDTRGPELFYLNSSNLILAAGKKIKIYNTDNHNFYKDEYACHSAIISLDISENGNYLAAGTTSGVCVWKVNNLRNSASIIDKLNNNYKISLHKTGDRIIPNSKGRVVAVKFTKNGEKLFATFKNGKIYSWESGFFYSEKLFTTKLKWLRTSIIAGNLILAIGTESKRGGIGRIEKIFINKSESQISSQKFRTYAPLLLINNGKYLLVGAKSNFRILPITE